MTCLINRLFQSLLKTLIGIQYFCIKMCAAKYLCACFYSQALKTKNRVHVKVFSGWSRDAAAG